MRFLLTGGYGCIGCWIIRNLIDRGQSFCVLDVRQDLRRLRLLLNDDEIAQVTFIAGDVTDLPALSRVIREQEITHVIHLAGLQVPTCRADPILGASVNVLGTLAVFEAVRQAQPQVKRLVYASSAAVIRSTRGLSRKTAPLPDDVPLVPSTHYGVFKHCNEENARIYFQDFGLSSVGLRPWAVYGVGRDFGMTSEPTKAIKSVALGRPVCDLLRRTAGLAIGRRRGQGIPSSGGVAVRGSEIVQPARRGRGHRRLSIAQLAAIAPEAQRLVTFGDRAAWHRAGFGRCRFSARFRAVAANAARGRHSQDAGTFPPAAERGRTRHGRS